MKKIITTLLLCTTILACATTTKTPTLNDKIGQLLVFGFVGTTPPQMAIDAIQKHRAGGAILFDLNLSDQLPTGGFGPRNVQSPGQLKTLVDSLQTIAKNAGLPPLFISIDQEGGRVNRLKTKYGFPETRSAKEIGEKNDTTFTHSESQKTAKTLKSLGINVNFAPCTDLGTNPQNPIIAGVERAFGADSKGVTEHNRAWVKGHKQEGIITSLKHFPGHGSSKADSHLGLVDITNSWDDSELDPYLRLVYEGYDDIIMIGHLFNRNIDSLYPSSLSKATIDILRQGIGYQGVVATDDMNMGAIVDHYSLDQALELALNAGVDIIIIGNNARVFEPDLVERAHRLITEMVADGRVSEERIDEAYNRIIKLKSRL